MFPALLCSIPSTNSFGHSCRHACWSVDCEIEGHVPGPLARPPRSVGGNEHEHAPIGLAGVIRGPGSCRRRQLGGFRAGRESARQTGARARADERSSHRALGIECDPSSSADRWVPDRGDPGARGRSCSRVSWAPKRFTMWRSGWRSPPGRRFATIWRLTRASARRGDAARRSAEVECRRFQGLGRRRCISIHPP